MNLPNSHIIGVQKSATTSLYHWLSQHDDIYAPLAAKDYPFFADDYHWRKGINKYSRLFLKHNKQKIILSGSVHTLNFTSAQYRLHKLFPDAKLIVSLRDPVDRLLSAYNYRVKSGVENLSFREALAHEKARSESPLFEDRAGGAYVSHGFYYKHLTKLLDVFSEKQLKIVWFEDITNKPKDTVKELYSFLGVDQCHLPTLIKKNTTGRVRNKWFFQLCFGNSNFRHWLTKNLLKKTLTLEQRTRIRHFLKEINTIPDKTNIPDGFCRDELISLYLKDIEQLELLTQKNLSHWKR